MAFCPRKQCNLLANDFQRQLIVFPWEFSSVSCLKFNPLLRFPARTIDHVWPWSPFQPTTPFKSRQFRWLLIHIQCKTALHWSILASNRSISRIIFSKNKNKSIGMTVPGVSRNNSFLRSRFVIFFVISPLSQDFFFHLYTNSKHRPSFDRIYHLASLPLHECVLLSCSILLCLWTKYFACNMLYTYTACDMICSCKTALHR